MCVFKDTFSHSVFSRPMMRLQTSATLNLSNNILSQHFMRVGFLTFLSSQIIPSSFFSCRPYFSKLYHLLPHTLEMLEPYSHKRKINRPCIDEFLMTSKIVSQFFSPTNQPVQTLEERLHWALLVLGDVMYVQFPFDPEGTISRRTHNKTSTCGMISCVCSIKWAAHETFQF